MGYMGLLSIHGFSKFQIQLALLNDNTDNRINRLMGSNWSIFTNLIYVLSSFAHCYCSVNLISSGLAQSDLIKRHLLCITSNNENFAIKDELLFVLVDAVVINDKVSMCFWYQHMIPIVLGLNEKQFRKWLSVF